MNNLKILFVCSANVDRSPTAENLFLNFKGIEARSAGTAVYARTPITHELIDWADKIFAMENKQREAILQIDGELEKKIVTLGIPDIYGRNQPELRRLILEKLEVIMNL
jgi:predicted protein tyrosine phosphatase